MTDFNLVSLNVRGLNNISKRKAVFKWLENKQYDIILLQETHTTTVSESVWNRDWKGPIFYSHGSNHSRGCTILIKNTLDFNVKSVSADTDEDISYYNAALTEK